VATKDDQADYDRLLQCLLEGNRAWAKYAPVLMLSVAKLRFEEDGEPNRHAFHDVGLAVENLVIQATALGLMVHQMAGFDIQKARETFEIPAGYEPVAAVAIGYPGDPAMLPDRERQRELGPHSRKPLQDSVFAGRWGRVSPLVTGPTPSR